jgi:hypothetical protein
VAIGKNILINPIEFFYSSVPEIPGRIELLSIPGIRAFVSPLSHPLANKVPKTTLDSDEVDNAIKAVLNFYVDRKKAFGWIIGPLTTPADLGNRLSSAGIVKRGETAGMVLIDLEVPIETNPSIRIRKANTDDIGVGSQVMAQAFPIPEDVSYLFSKVWMLYGDQLRSSTYLAFLEGIDEPITYGKGIYTSLPACHLVYARKEGAKVAAILAIPTRLAPICWNLSFKGICGLEFYTWKPESVSWEGLLSNPPKDQ